MAQTSKRQSEQERRRKERQDRCKRIAEQTLVVVERVLANDPSYGRHQAMGAIAYALELSEEQGARDMLVRAMEHANAINNLDV